MKTVLRLEASTPDRFPRFVAPYLFHLFNLRNLWIRSSR